MFKYFINIFLFVSITLSQELIEIQKINQPVNDYANILSTEEIADLNRKIILFEDSTSVQIAIGIFQTLNGEDESDFAQRFVKVNPIGDKEKNNGIAIIVSIEERKVKIETGYGVEEFITDAIANQIIRKLIAPNFRNGNYYAGINNSVIQIIELTDDHFKGKKKNNFSISNIIFLVILFLLFPLFSSSRSSITGRGVRRGIYASGFYGGFGGGNFFGGSGGGSSWSSGGGSFGGGGSSGSW